MTRREFLAATAALTVSPWLGCEGEEREPPADSPPDEIPRRALGRTGERVSVLGLGGWHMGVAALTEEESVRIVRTAIDGGVTFLDNCWDYNDGESERRMGRALRDGYRERVFLMTKVDGRTKASATRQLDECLARLGTDRVDLLQLHEVVHEEDPVRAFEEGAFDALLEARAAGKVRYLGFTGHKSPRLHLRMLDAAEAAGLRLDTVQLPLNVLDAHFDSFERNVLPRLVELGIGAIGMKPMADARIVNAGIATPEECLAYAMSLPVSVVITGCESLERVEQALRVARGFQPLDEEQVNAILAKTAGPAASGEVEAYKTTDRYDATKHNPSWLG
jgi:aryl-alcohol dehydrogenase-like predicted oxidoreductase